MTEECKSICADWDAKRPDLMVIKEKAICEVLAREERGEMPEECEGFRIRICTLQDGKTGIGVEVCGKNGDSGSAFASMAEINLAADVIHVAWLNRSQPLAFYPVPPEVKTAEVTP